jgi:hypothetical protein
MPAGWKANTFCICLRKGQGGIVLCLAKKKTTSTWKLPILFRSDIFDTKKILLCISGVSDTEFREVEGIIPEVFTDFLSCFYILWTSKEITRSNIEEIIHVSRVNNLLKCPKNVTKHTNPLEVGVLMTSKFVAVLVACRKSLTTDC